MVAGREPDHLTALVRSIVFQQLSGKAAATIFRRVLALLPPHQGTARAEHWLAVADDKLREAGLSRPKITYVRDLCERVADGRLALDSLEQLDDEAALEAIVQVKGFGRWSANMYLLFHLGRPDVWAPDDLGLRKAVMKLDGLDELPAPALMAQRAERWRPYRSVASWYLWRMLDVRVQDNVW